MDRFAKSMLGIIAICAVTLTIQQLSSPPLIAHAQTKAHGTCVWTYITDGGAPSVGRDGKVELKGDNWKKVSAEGWSMKTALPVGSGVTAYIFEKCE